MGLTHKGPRKGLWQAKCRRRQLDNILTTHTELITPGPKRLQRFLHKPIEPDARYDLCTILGDQMKKVGDLFQELGFNENGSDEVKIAFIKNLVKAAYGVELAGPKQKVFSARSNTKQAPAKVEQLSFNIEEALKKAN